MFLCDPTSAHISAEQRYAPAAPNSPSDAKEGFVVDTVVRRRLGLRQGRVALRCSVEGARSGIRVLPWAWPGRRGRGCSRRIRAIRDHLYTAQIDHSRYETSCIRVLHQRSRSVVYKQNLLFPPFFASFLVRVQMDVSLLLCSILFIYYAFDSLLPLK